MTAEEQKKLDNNVWCLGIPGINTTADIAALVKRCTGVGKGIIPKVAKPARPSDFRTGGKGWRIHTKEDGQ